MSTPFQQIALGMLFLQGHLDPSTAAAWRREDAAASPAPTGARTSDAGAPLACAAACCGCPA